MDNANLYMLEELTDDEDFLELVLQQELRAPRVFRDRPNHYEKWDNDEFRNRFRLSKPVVQYLVDRIRPAISPSTARNNALSADEMVFATLRFLATGSIHSVVGELCGIDKASSCRAIDKVITAIAELHHEFISMPTNLDEILEVRQRFYNICKFPRCIGALDCTHVRIQSPGGENAELFRNRKGFFSFNVQALCDAELIIRYVVCRWHGSAHDANIFKNSRLRARLENEEFGGDSLIVGDSGYGIKKYLITPLANPHTPAEQLFNEAQIRTRNPIERCFGVWKRRFPILSLGIRQNICKIERIIITTAILLNIACLMRDQLPHVNDEEEAAIAITNNVDIPIQAMNAANINNLTRHLLITEYFQRLL